MNGGAYKKPMPLAVRPWSIAVMLAGLLASGKFLAAADRAASPDNAEERAHAAYPKPFSRPNSMGGDYDTWRDAKGPDIGEKIVDVKRLPSRVDNSTRPQFPPIYKQKGGACGQFTSVASMFTYEMNVLNGTVASTTATHFPADFSWNMCNAANSAQGSEAYHGWETAKHIGIPTVKTYGRVEGDKDKIGMWANGYSIWREAMEYRVAGYRYTPVATAAQIDEARGWLFDRNQPKPGKESIGGLLALDGRMGKLKEVTRTIPEGDYLAGEDLWIRWGPSGYGHGITCVGYDDQVGFDVNGDGKLDLLEARRWWENPTKNEELGTKNFIQHNFAAGVGGGAQMFAYDFDGNGTQDVFTSLAAHRYGVAVFLQTKNKEPGTANWSRVMLASEQPQDNDYGIVFSQPHAAHLADIDGDGIKDIVTGKRYWAHNGHDPDEHGHRVLYWYQTKRDGKGGVDFIPHLIDANTGVVTTAVMFNREASGPTRNISIRATSADGSYSDQVFTIAINDVNEFGISGIVDSNAAANALNENSANGTVVGITAAASDEK